jgi:uncharacterized protein YozE (UPF0346 family)
MHKFTTFYEWLAKRKSRKSPLGALAGDALEDAGFPKDVASLDALLTYMRTKKAAGMAIATARIAWQTYAREQGDSGRGSA